MAYRSLQADGEGTGCRTSPLKHQTQVLLCMNGCTGRVHTQISLNFRLHMKVTPAHRAASRTMPQTICQNHMRMWVGGAALAWAR